MVEIEEFKEMNKNIWETWIVGIVSSAIGITSIRYGINIETNLFGKILLVLFGIFLQIPLGYFKIYKSLLNQ